MKFLELTINTTHEAEELISSLLWEYTSYGVSICDDNDVLELINNRRNTWDYLEDKLTENLGFNSTLIKCYFDLEDGDNKISLIEKDLQNFKENNLGNLDFGSLETIKRIVDGDDWIEIWKKHYKPISLGKIVVCPSWINYEKKEGQEVVVIDSNQAFGTGEHETTSMCIGFLQNYVNKDSIVIDIGTGSGILGISAIKLGAKKSVMTDIDEIAVISAIHNAKINGVYDNCLISLDNLLSESDKVGDIIVANITADILCVLANSITKHVKDDTVLILSGILKEKAELVVETYKKIGFNVINSKNIGEWVALALKKL